MHVFANCLKLLRSSNYRSCSVSISRRKEEEDPIVVPVYGNLSKPPSTRNMPTKRDIYLPERNFGTVNSAFFEEGESPRKEDIFLNVNENSYENIEAKMKFDEEFPIESTTDDKDDITVESLSSSTDYNYVHVLPPDDLINISTAADDLVNTSTAADDQENTEEVNSLDGTDVVPHVFYDELVTAL